jgi:hypothetical protein
MANTLEVQEKIRAERITKLKKYAEHVKARIAGGIPESHKYRAKEFRAWLDLDLKRTLKKIESLGG